MPADQLLTIQRANFLFGAAATALAGVIWGLAGMLAAAVGAVLAIANFWAVQRLGARAVARVASGESLPRALALVAALVAKMAFLVALIWLLIRRVGLPVLPFTMGLSVLVLAILTTGLYQGAAGSKLPPAADPSAPETTAAANPH